VVVEGGNDFQTVREDGTLILDVRLILRSDDDELITVTYTGMRNGDPDVLRRIDAGEAVPPEQYYFRTNPMFETASNKHGWLNRILAVGVGYRHDKGAIYSLFVVL
jgi:hypothetical protein